MMRNKKLSIYYILIISAVIKISRSFGSLLYVGVFLCLLYMLFVFCIYSVAILFMYLCSLFMCLYI